MDESETNTESELCAIVECAREVMWLRTLLHEIGEDQAVYDPTPIYEDNNAAKVLAQTFVIRTRHIGVQQSCLNDWVLKQFLSIVRVNSGDNVADLFTKALNKRKFKDFIPRLVL